MVQLSRKELREEIKSKLEAAMICGQRICIDLSMENTMTSKVISGDTLKLKTLLWFKFDMYYPYFVFMDRNLRNPHSHKYTGTCIRHFIFLSYIGIWNFF